MLSVIPVSSIIPERDKREETQPTCHQVVLFIHFEIDFMQMNKCCNFENVLVIVDMFSKWVEAYPCWKVDATTVAKSLISDVICRYGTPTRLSSDGGSHFTDQIVQELCKALQINQHFHCPYHPQSAGAVEAK